jgi:hypothetical protein
MFTSQRCFSAKEILGHQTLGQELLSVHREKTLLEGITSFTQENRASPLMLGMHWVWKELDSFCLQLPSYRSLEFRVWAEVQLDLPLVSPVSSFHGGPGLKGSGYPSWDDLQGIPRSHHVQIFFHVFHPWELENLPDA